MGYIIQPLYITIKDSDGDEVQINLAKVRSICKAGSRDIRFTFSETHEVFGEYRDTIERDKQYDNIKLMLAGPEGG